MKFHDDKGGLLPYEKLDPNSLEALKDTMETLIEMGIVEIVGHGGGAHYNITEYGQSFSKEEIDALFDDYIKQIPDGQHKQ